MKFLFFFMVLIFISFTRAFAFDVTLLQNNKEAVSRIVTNKDRSSLATWLKSHPLRDEARTRAVSVFRSTMVTFEARDGQCDPGLVQLLLDNAKSAGVIQQETELRQLLVLLRTQNEMDDILMNIMLKADEVRIDLANAGRWKAPRISSSLGAAPAGMDLKKYFGMVTPWPDDVSYCSIGRYMRMAEMVTAKTPAERNNTMLRLATIGLRDGMIDRITFNKLNALRLDGVLTWDHYAYNYLNMIENAKDKMAKTREAVAANNFSATYASRKEKLTQRGRLYKMFSPTQVMIMSGVIEKLTRRLDARRVDLIFQYGPNSTIQSQTYVLSPMEQYRVAINMMRKEMGELMRGDLFAGTGIQYEDIIAASYETGLIKSEELDHILKFEEFWNPKGESRFRTYANFAFSIAGTATFYLPPPFNIMGAVALMFTQSRLLPTTQKPDPDDNWNVII
jgi:hypothetical protein